MPVAAAARNRMPYINSYVTHTCTCTHLHTHRTYRTTNRKRYCWPTYQQGTMTRIVGITDGTREKKRLERRVTLLWCTRAHHAADRG